MGAALVAERSNYSSVLLPCVFYCLIALRVHLCKKHSFTLHVDKISLVRDAEDYFPGYDQQKDIQIQIKVNTLHENYC